MTLDLILFNCTAFLPKPLHDAYIGIKDGKIAYIGSRKPDTIRNAIVLDLQGHYVLPGLIDSHVHFREPGLAHKEDYEHGSLAALAGGVTTILDMPNTKPEICTIAALREKEYSVRHRSYVHYGHHFLLTKSNLNELKQLHPQDVASVKVFMAGHETADCTVYHFEYLMQAAAILAEKNIIMTVHAEYEPLLDRLGSKLLHEYELARGREAAVHAVNMMIDIARQTRCRIHIVHTSTEEEADLILAAKSKGIPVTCEVIPPHLVFTNDDLIMKGWDFKLSPPLRTKRDTAFLWKSLLSGGIDTVGSDHAPHTQVEKRSPNPPAGMPGVQEMVSVLFTGLLKQGLISEQAAVRLATLAAKRPAELFNLRYKGQLSQGFDADIVVFDPSASFIMTDDRVHSKCKWSLYNQQKLYGEVRSVFLDGMLVYANHAVHTKQPTGRPVIYDAEERAAL